MVIYMLLCYGGGKGLGRVSLIGHTYIARREREEKEKRKRRERLGSSGLLFQWCFFFQHSASLLAILRNLAMRVLVVSPLDLAVGSWNNSPIPVY